MSTPRAHVEESRTVREPSAAATALAHLVDAAAAEELDTRLKAIRAGGKLVTAAHADPQRALAWLDVAATEARHPAGFVQAGLDSGEWPSPRQPAGISTSSRQAWLENTAPTLGPDLAHDIVAGWDDLDPGELAQWHQSIDDLFGAVEPERQRGVA